MENKNWSVFYTTIINNHNTIKELFSYNDLVLDNKKVEIEKNDANENQKEFEAWKTKLISKVGEEKKQEFENLLIENRALLQKREDAIGRLNQTIEGLKSKYREEKQTCDKACSEMGKVIEDKEGWLDIMAEVIRVQNMDNNNAHEKQKSVVEKKKSDYDCLFCCKTVGLALLVLLSIGAQVFLFTQLEVYNDQGVVPSYNVLNNCVLVAAMIILLVSEFFLVLGIIRLSKKKNFILQRLELILNKIEMRKVSKFEINRDLEKVLEEMK